MQILIGGYVVANNGNFEFSVSLAVGRRVSRVQTDTTCKLGQDSDYGQPATAPQHPQDEAALASFGVK